MSEPTRPQPGDDDLYAHLRERGEVGWRRVMQSEPEATNAIPGSYPDLSHTLLFGDI